MKWSVGEGMWPVIKFFLRFLAPGQEWASFGRWGRAALCLLVNILGLSVALWAIVSGHLFLPTVALVWIVFQFVLSQRLANASGIMVEDCCDENGKAQEVPPVQGNVRKNRAKGVSLFWLFFLPLVACTVLIPFLAGTVPVADDSFPPGLVAGDRIFYVKQPSGEVRRRGDLVVVRCSDSALDFGRVVGLPGEELWTERNRICLKEGCFQTRGLESQGNSSPDSRHAVEVAGDRFYLISTRESQDQGGGAGLGEGASVKLGAEEYGVLSDDRGGSFLARCTRHGAVSNESLVGQPLYVIVSTDLSRIGIRLR